MKKCDIFLMFAQNIDGGTGAVLASTHDLYFRAKIIKIMYTFVNPSFTIHMKKVKEHLLFYEG